MGWQKVSKEGSFHRQTQKATQATTPRDAPKEREQQGLFQERRKTTTCFLRWSAPSRGRHFGRSPPGCQCCQRNAFANRPETTHSNEWAMDGTELWTTPRFQGVFYTVAFVSRGILLWSIWIFTRPWKGHEVAMCHHWWITIHRQIMGRPSHLSGHVGTRRRWRCR